MAVEIKIPEMGESITEATILNWLVKEGDPVQQDEILLELETDKITMELPAPATGIINKIIKGDDTTVTVHEVIGLIEEGEVSKSASKEQDSIETPKSPAVKIPAASAVQTSPTTDLKTAAVTQDARDEHSPAVRKLLLDNNLKAENISPSGKDGRLLKEDILKHLNKPVPQVAQASKGAPAGGNLEEVKPM